VAKTLQSFFLCGSASPRENIFPHPAGISAHTPQTNTSFSKNNASILQQSQPTASPESAIEKQGLRSMRFVASLSPKILHEMNHTASNVFH